MSAIEDNISASACYHGENKTERWFSHESNRRFLSKSRASDNLSRDPLQVKETLNIKKDETGTKASQGVTPFSVPREINKACYRSNEKEVLKMPYNRKAFGVVISKLRVQKGLTQENLSGLAGIARSHLAALESGEKTVKLDTMWRIAEALGISPSELVRRTENEHPE